MVSYIDHASSPPYSPLIHDHSQEEQLTEYLTSLIRTSLHISEVYFSNDMFVQRPFTGGTPMTPSPHTALTLGQLIGLVVFAISMATGQVLFKLGATRVAPATDLDGWISLIFQPIVITALGLYGAATFLWLWLLQKIPLTTAYPFAALAFVLVPLGGWIFFNESVNLKYIGGVSLILAGVILTSLSR